eukprot:COSAG05_NODE_133_length_17087_cov_268.363374_1_plen_70_part_00
MGGCGCVSIHLLLSTTYLPTYLHVSIYLYLQYLYLIIGLYFHVFAFTGATKASEANETMRRTRTFFLPS